MSTVLMLASDVAGPVRPGVVRSSGLATDLLIVFGAGALLFLALVVWAVYFRRRSGHRHRHHHGHHSPRPSVSSEPSEPPVSDADESPHRHHRRRRRRREHRGRNPTLSETGGLPPPRPGDLLPPAV